MRNLNLFISRSRTTNTNVLILRDEIARIRCLEDSLKFPSNSVITKRNECASTINNQTGSSFKSRVIESTGSVHFMVNHTNIMHLRVRRCLHVSINQPNLAGQSSDVVITRPVNLTCRFLKRISMCNNQSIQFVCILLHLQQSSHRTTIILASCQAFFFQIEDQFTVLQQTGCTVMSSSYSTNPNTHDLSSIS